MNEINLDQVMTLLRELPTHPLYRDQARKWLLEENQTVVFNDGGGELLRDALIKIESQPRTIYPGLPHH